MSHDIAHPHLADLGEILRVEDVARIFRSSPAAIRSALARQGGLGDVLRPALLRRRGRRIFFDGAALRVALTTQTPPQKS
jgi:hypothetical protein